MGENQEPETYGEFSFKRIDYLPVVGFFTSLSRINKKRDSQENPGEYSKKHLEEIHRRALFMAVYNLGWIVFGIYALSGLEKILQN